MFENSDEMLNSNSSLFDLSESDLTLPEPLTFPKGEVIEGTVLDCSSIEKIGAVRLEVLVSNTDHAEKNHEFLVMKPKPSAKDGKINPTQKKFWVEFLLAFWSKENILANNVDLSSVVGKRITYQAAEAREHNGKTYQSFFGFKEI